MAYDEEDDDQLDESRLSETLGENDGASADLSAAGRKRAPLDFSHLIPKEAKNSTYSPPKESETKKGRREPLDFSQFIPTVKPSEVPLPRARPAEAGPAAVAPATAPEPSPLPPDIDPMTGLSMPEVPPPAEPS